MIVATATTGCSWLVVMVGLHCPGWPSWSRSCARIWTNIGHNRYDLWQSGQKTPYLPVFRSGVVKSTFLTNQTAGMGAECTGSNGISFSGQKFSPQDVFRLPPLTKYVSLVSNTKPNRARCRGGDQLLGEYEDGPFNVKYCSMTSLFSQG